MTDTLRCPSCGSDDIGTAEKIDGLAEAVFTLDSTGALVVEHGGETKVYWDTSTTVGYGCNGCGQWYEQADWREHLVANQPPPKCVDCEVEDALDGQERCWPCDEDAAVDAAAETRADADREARLLDHVDV